MKIITDRIPKSRKKIFIDRRKKEKRKTVLPIDIDKRQRERRKIKNRREKDQRRIILSIAFEDRRIIEQRKMFYDNYSQKVIEKRRQWISKKTGVKLNHIGFFSFYPQETKGNIENLIGATQIPIGIAGPLKVNGDYAKGNFYVPMTTTEGTLVEAYHRGMIIITHSGGVNIKIITDGISITPVFILKNIQESVEFISWIKTNFREIKNEAEKTTKYGKLIKIEPFIIGRRAFMNFRYTTGDAMGLNMINISTDRACKWICEKMPTVENYFLRSNLSSDKKASFFNLITSYGKEVLAEATISENILNKFYHISSKELYNFWYCGVLGSIQAGIIGLNGHFANGLASVYLACGQDLAQIVNASTGIVNCEIKADSSLYITLKLPNLILATVGGGTILPTQRECLELLGCYGEGKINKFSEIIAGFLLAGELTLYATLASGQFINGHKTKHTFTKNLIKGALHNA